MSEKVDTENVLRRSEITNEKVGSAGCMPKPRDYHLSEEELVMIEAATHHDKRPDRVG